MSRILLSILLAIAAVGANAQFKGSVDIMYKMEPRTHVISFNFARVCQQLGVDKDEFGLLLRRQWYGNSNVKRDYGLYLLTDGGGETDSYYILTPDGRKAGSPSEGLWRCEMTCEHITSNRFDFFVCPRTDGSDDEYPLGKVGDTYNAVFALEYQGRIATFDISMSLTEEEGPAIPLSSLEKVGEKVLSGCIDYSVGDNIEFDLTGVASLFGDDVEGGNLQLYGMKDAEQQLITGNYSMDSGICVKIDGTRCMRWDWRTTNFYTVGYNVFNEESLRICADPTLFPGGQKTSGSVFLVADGKYYELILDVQFGDEYEDGTPPESMDAKKNRFDFTHTIKTKPHAPRRNGSGDAEESEMQPLYGEYNDLQLDIHLNSLNDTYQVRITNESGQVVYEKTINAVNIAALIIDISAYAKGRYTVTLENSFESFTGEFEALTTGIEAITNNKEVIRHNIYNLQGQRLSSLQKGLNIVNGQKIFVK